MNQIKIALYALVIVAAPTLDSPWMVAMQAALGGFMIGARVERLLTLRYQTP